MTRRGGPKRKLHASSATANTVSDKGHEESDDAVLDFLYYDAARIGSFLAQVDTGGHLQSVKQGDMVSRGKTRGHSIKAAVNLPAILGMTAEGAEGSVEFGSNPGEAGSTTGERTYDPFWTNARTFIDFFNAEGLINDKVNTAGMGQFVRHTGSLWLLDMTTIQAIIASPIMGALISSLSDLEAIQAQLVIQMIPILQLGVQLTVVGKNQTVWGTLRPNSLTSTPGDLMLQHGSQVAGEWTMLGILDAKPDSNMSTTPPPFEGLAQALIGLGSIRPQIGRPVHAYGVTPLLIYREVSGNN